MFKIITIYFLPFIFCLLFFSYAFCNDEQKPFNAIVNFTVPSNWEKVNYYIYELKEKNYLYWREAILKGNQSWGSDPVKVAAESLWNFGIKGYSKDIFSLSDSLVEVNENEFMLKIGNRTYLVYVSAVNAPPIAPIAYVAYKLKIKDDNRNNIEKPPIVDRFACSDYCPGPREKYMVKIYQGVEDEDECRKLGGRFATYVGWGAFHICIAE